MKHSFYSNSDFPLLYFPSSLVIFFNSSSLFIENHFQNWYKLKNFFTETLKYEPREDLW